MGFEGDIKLFSNAAVSFLIFISIKPIEVVSKNAESPYLLLDFFFFIIIVLFYNLQLKTNLEPLMSLIPIWF